MGGIGPIPPISAAGSTPGGGAANPGPNSFKIIPALSAYSLRNLSSLLMIYKIFIVNCE
jgi:hypothetical protein